MGTTNNKNKVKPVDKLYQQVTDRIVKAIETGNLGDWIKGWSATGLPTNFTTNKAYRGINNLILWCVREDSLFRSNLWATYLQITKAGGTVLKGEKSTPIIFNKRELVVNVKDVDLETGELQELEDPRYRWVSRTFNVFNIDQTDLNIEDFEKVNNVNMDDRIAEVEMMIHNYPIEYRFGGDRAAYYPVEDYIRLPLRQSFNDNSQYYSSVAHEQIHSTSSVDKLDRSLNYKVDQDTYAKEELVAELGAAMLCAHFGIEGELQHESYLDHWLKILKADPKALYYVSGMAQKACDYMLSFAK